MLSLQYSKRKNAATYQIKILLGQHFLIKRAFWKQVYNRYMLQINNIYIICDCIQMTEHNVVSNSSESPAFILFNNNLQVKLCDKNKITIFDNPNTLCTIDTEISIKYLLILTILFALTHKSYKRKRKRIYFKSTPLHNGMFATMVVIKRKPL